MAIATVTEVSGQIRAASISLKSGSFSSLPTNGTVEMSFDPSTLPLPTHGSDASDALSSTMEQGPFPGAPDPDQTSLAAPRPRRPSGKSTGIARIKRSASTPNVRASADSSQFAGDKRRGNKLGYHRTSVACGHCRRRKIRCLLEPDDKQGRCSNCIRLKKECNFFPVDQQPQNEKRPRTTVKADRTPGGTSTASSPSNISPSILSGSVYDQTENFNEWPVPLTPNQRGGDDGRQRTELNANSQKAPLIPRGYEYQHRADRQPGWEGGPYLDQPGPIQKTNLEDPSTNFWKLAESPGAPAFSNSGTPANGLSQSGDGSNLYAFGTHRADVGWPLPSRSMSLGHVEEYPQQYPGHYQHPHDFKHAPAHQFYPHSLNTNNGSMAPLSEPHSAPVGSNAMQPPYGLPPPWNPTYPEANVGGMGHRSSEGYPTWPGNLSRVHEEGGVHHFPEDHGVYNYPTTQATG